MVLLVEDLPDSRMCCLTRTHRRTPRKSKDQRSGTCCTLRALSIFPRARSRDASTRVTSPRRSPNSGLWAPAEQTKGARAATAASMRRAAGPPPACSSQRASSSSCAGRSRRRWRGGDADEDERARKLEAQLFAVLKSCPLRVKGACQILVRRPERLC